MQKAAVPPVIDYSQHKTVSLLVIGKSGAGKTTLVNAFVNHFHGRQFEEEPLILIPQTNDQKCSFAEYAAYCDPNEIVEGNEGASKTQITKSYYFKSESENRSLIIIDTPGLGDARGSTQDQTNINNIIQGLKKVSFIHAVIFVIQPQTRKDFVFKFYVDQIKNLLPRSCTDQFLVVCTRSNGEVDEDIVEVFSDTLGFKPDPKRWFCMENKRATALVWKKTGKIFNKIYEMASSFPKIHTKDFDELFQRRKKMETKIQGMIQAIEAHKVFFGIQLKILEGNKDQIEKIEDFVSRESTKKHTKPTNYTNFNCIECHKTCVLNTSGWFFRMFSEKNGNEQCDVCHHQNGLHSHEDQIRFIGLDEDTMNRLQEKLDQLLETAGAEFIFEKIKRFFKSIIDENMDNIAQLTVDIEKLGIVDADTCYDSFLYFLDSELYLLDSDKNLDLETKKERKEALQEQKVRYAEIKKRHLQVCYQRDLIHNELKQKPEQSS